MKKIILLLCSLASILPASNFDLSINPPASLEPTETPMFVCFGWDDNAYSDAMNWITDFTDTLNNQDGSGVRHTFFITTGFGSGQKIANQQEPAKVLASWRKAYADGHEIANHTELHEPKKATEDSDYWAGAISRANQFLVDSIVGNISEIQGFRTPFLGYSAPTFQAIKDAGFRYDCSIEVGTKWYSIKKGYDGENGWVKDIAFEVGFASGAKKHWWPYDLAIGAANGSVAVPGSILPSAGDNLNGLLEVQVNRYVYPANILTDEELLSIDGTLPVSGMTGFDFNIFKGLSARQKNKEKILHLLKFNYQQRMQGNRCPLTVNLHTDLYSEYKTTVNEPSSQDYIYDSVEERRWIIEEFTKYILQFPDVRIVPYATMLDWMENPVNSSDYIAPTKSGSVPITKAKATQTPNVAMSTENSILKLSIPSAGAYTITVATLAGRVVNQIHSGNLSAGNHTFDLNSAAVAPGVYIFQVEGVVNGISRVVID